MAFHVLSSPVTRSTGNNEHEFFEFSLVVSIFCGALVYFNLWEININHGRLHVFGIALFGIIKVLIL